MKKINLVAVMLFCGVTLFAQAVKDRNVIPVAVNLNQVLRMTITNGGNIEFVFNTIDDYKNGLSSEAASNAQNPAGTVGFYKTDFTISSSTRWLLNYGAEQASFLGTDNPATTFALDNVGFTITHVGGDAFETPGSAQGSTNTASLYSAPTDNASEVTALQAYPVALIEDNGTDAANAGDAADLSFTLNWRCGTAEQGAVNPMNAVKLIDQNPSPAPDRYVVNVLFDLVMI
ncbi:MAG TPA: hypothetical protein VK152_03075 [Paludibacter sp.]|nr:hypothetical protein [Paludibacter sp.]